ncbi:hypothetical protein BC828DRAFT_405752 [Blastocladiella britannica]|nr:hypothetical protein BC828DRAFT_405752 [Blastocladiella britannica]
MVVPSTCRVRVGSSPLTALEPCAPPSSLAASDLAQCQDRNGCSSTAADFLDCTISSCPREFVAAASTICVPLSWPALANWHLSAANTTDPLLDQIDGGICLPTLPIGYPCDPDVDLSSYLPFSQQQQGQQQRKWTLAIPPPPPFPRISAVLAVPAGSSPAAKEALPAFVASEHSPLPPYLILTGPNDGQQSIASLVTCDRASRRFVAALPLGAACTDAAQCRSLACLSSSSSSPSMTGGICVAGSATPPTIVQSLTLPSSNTTSTNPPDPSTGKTTSNAIPNFIVLGIAAGIYFIILCAPRTFRVWKAANKHRFGVFSSAQRELTLQPSSRAMLEPVRRGGWRITTEADGMGGRRVALDAELGMVVVEGEEGLPRYETPAEDDSDVGGDRQDHDSDRLAPAAETLRPALVVTTLLEPPPPTYDATSPPSTPLTTSDRRG